MLASRRFICLYNSDGEQQKRLTVIIVFFSTLLLLLYFINRHDLYSSNSASTLQVKAVANPRSIFLQGVRESIKIAHSITHSIVSASLYYINPSSSESLKLSFKIIQYEQRISLLQRFYFFVYLMGWNTQARSVCIWRCNEESLV